MDLKLFHCLKYKVTRKASAIFADNMMMLTMFKCGYSWDLKFTTQEYYDEFFLNYGYDIVIDFDDIVLPLYDDHLTYHDMWHVTEEALTKHLYILKKKFYKIYDKGMKIEFLFHCALMIYLAFDYYKKGVQSALTIVFLEVYSLACYYSERVNFKRDLVTTYSED